jgi:hypothetical protein
MAAEALRSSGFTTSVSLRSNSGFHDARGRSTAPGRRGPVFPRLLRLPPPRTTARGGSGMDSAAPAAKGARHPRWRPLYSPLLSLPPLLLLFTDSWWWRRILMGIREAGWGLGSYRWPARVWGSRDGRRVAIPRGVASIAWHQHSKRQPWGRHELAASPLSPSQQCHREKKQRGRKTGYDG